MKVIRIIIKNPFVLVLNLFTSKVNIFAINSITIEPLIVYYEKGMEFLASTGFKLTDVKSYRHNHHFLSSLRLTVSIRFEKTNKF